MGPKRRAEEDPAALEAVDPSNLFAQFAFGGPGAGPSPAGTYEQGLPSSVSASASADPSPPPAAAAVAAVAAAAAAAAAPAVKRPKPELQQPVIAPDGLWRERYASVCEPCYRAAIPCLHFSEVPLRLLIIGHNPSDHTYDDFCIYKSSCFSINPPYSYQVHRQFPAQPSFQGCLSHNDIACVN